MLLFQKAFHQGLVSGQVTVTFRRWQKPHVKVGGRYRCHPIGVLEVHAVARVAVERIVLADAIAAGFDTRDALLAYMAGVGDAPLLPSTEVWRVDLRHAGDGDRVATALEADLGADDVALLTKKLARLDADAPWTKKTLATIEAFPRVAASKLALKLGRDRDELKTDIRKLKRLGLTQSFEVGYEISPRGRTFLEATRTKRRRPTATVTKSPATGSPVTERASKKGPTPKTTTATARRRARA